MAKRHNNDLCVGRPENDSLGPFQIVREQGGVSSERCTGVEIFLMMLKSISSVILRLPLFGFVKNLRRSLPGGGCRTSVSLPPSSWLFDDLPRHGKLIDGVCHRPGRDMSVSRRCPALQRVALDDIDNAILHGKCEAFGLEPMPARVTRVFPRIAKPCSRIHDAR